MLDHFEPNSSHIPVVMTLFEEFQNPKLTSPEEVAYDDHRRDVSLTRTPQSWYGVLSDWRATLLGVLTRCLGRNEPHGIDSCDPSGA